MNRKGRRALQKQLRKEGKTKIEAKNIVANKSWEEPFVVGQKCKLNYEWIIRRPDFKKQTNDFQNWVHAHKNDLFTVEQTRKEGREVTLLEADENHKFWHFVETLIPIASATIKLNNGKRETIALDGVTSAEDPEIIKKINQTLERFDGEVVFEGESVNDSRN